MRAPIWKVDRERARRARRLGRVSARDIAAERALDRAINVHGGRTRRALLEAFEFLADELPVRAVTDRLRFGDIDGAMDLIGPGRVAERMRGQGLPPGTSSVVDEMTATLRDGGTAGRSQMPPTEGRLVGSLDLTNPEALEYLRTTLPAKITMITDDVRESIRQTLEAGMIKGTPAPKMAREIRPMIGLTPNMSEYVGNFRMQLEHGVLGGQTPPWERRLSGPERSKAIQLFRHPLPPPREVDALVGAYAKRLRNKRAHDIAVTETHAAFMEGQKEIWRQAVEMDLLDPAATRRRWLVTPDERLRPEHADMPNLNPNGVGLTEPFRAIHRGEDILVMAPGLSGEPGFDINCRCVVTLDIED